MSWAIRQSSRSTLPMASVSHGLAPRAQSHSSFVRRRALRSAASRLARVVLPDPGNPHVRISRTWLTSLSSALPWADPSAGERMVAAPKRNRHNQACAKYGRIMEAEWVLRHDPGQIRHAMGGPPDETTRRSFCDVWAPLDEWRHVPLPDGGLLPECASCRGQI